MEFLRKNFAIVLAFALPIVLIVIVALTAYLPSFFLSTKYNFVYATCFDETGRSSYDCGNSSQKRYAVLDGKIVVNKSGGSSLDFDGDGIPDNEERYTVRIFLHDTERNESREITLKEAQTLTLNGLLTSPDGITVSNDYDRGGSDFFIFGTNSSSYGYYLTKGKSRDKLNLISSDNWYYRDNFQFIGWVLPGRS